VKQKKIAVYFI